MHDTALALSRRLAVPSLVRQERKLPSSDWRDGLPTLEGRIVTLRELEAGDAARLLPQLTTPEVISFLSPPPASIEQFTGFIEATLRERQAGRYAAFAVVPHGQSAPIGIVQVRQLEPGFGTAEWGVALGSEWWGRGVFVDAGRLALDFAFTTLGVRRLEARVAARNARGNGAVQKLGAVAEGLLRSSLLVADGTRHDQVLWAWLEEDWRRGRQASVEASAWVH